MFENVSNEQKKRILSILGQMELEGKDLYDVVFDKKYFINYIKTEIDMIDFIVLEKNVKKYINMYPKKFEEYLEKHPEHKDKIDELNKENKSNNFKSFSPKNITIESSFKFEWQEINPYTILGIEEKEYTNDELLEIISKKIKLIQENSTDKEKMKNDIDKILDAYNELTKTNNKKR